MQAATAGREKDFGALLRRLGERAWRDPMADEARAAFAGVAGLLRDELGVVASPAAVQEAHDTARLLGGTRYRAFSPSDTCPDNNLVTSRGVRFVDFEWGCFRDIVLDAAYFRVPFPGCEASFALPPGMADTLLATWRNEIAAVWPDLDESGAADARLFDAQLLWVWLCTWWMLPRIRVRDQHVGLDAARSPRISTALRTTGISSLPTPPSRGRRRRPSWASRWPRRSTSASRTHPPRCRSTRRSAPRATQASAGDAGRPRAGACGVAMVMPASISQSCARVQVGQIQVTVPSASCWLLQASPAESSGGAGEGAERTGSGGLHGSRVRATGYGMVTERRTTRCVDLRLLAVRLTVVRP